MKHILITTIAAVLLVGCGPLVPDISIHNAIRNGNIEAVKQHLATDTDVNAKNRNGLTSLKEAVDKNYKAIVELLIANGGSPMSFFCSWSYS